MDLQTRLNKVASDYGLTADVQQAIAATVMLDRNNDVKIDARDLPATAANIFASLPTANPGIAGRVWLNSGVVTVSAG